MKTIWFDLDNTLADFSIKRSLDNSLQRYDKEKGFFEKLIPINTSSPKVLRDLMTKGYEIGIISHSPNKQADEDKVKWVNKYYPFIKNKNIICQRLGDNKGDFISPGDYLVDDRVKNLLSCVIAGGIGIRACFHNPNSKKWRMNIINNIKEIYEFL